MNANTGAILKSAYSGYGDEWTIQYSSGNKAIQFKSAGTTGDYCLSKEKTTSILSSCKYSSTNWVLEFPYTEV